MALATREQILGLQDIGFEDIDMGDVPGWEGITIRVKDLTARERDNLEKGIIVERKVRGVNGKVETKQELRDNVRAVFCAACIVGDDGKPLFGREDVAALGGKSARALDKIFGEIKRRNGIGEQDIEELVEDFDSGQADDSHID